MTRLWHAVVAALAAFALVGQTYLVIDTDSSIVNLFSYFTIQSNILVMVTSALLALDPARGGRLFTAVRLAGLVGITVTGVVFALILAGQQTFEGMAWWYDKIFHYAVPIGAVVGFLVFTPRTRFAKADLWFIVWPLAWLAYTLTRGAVSDPQFAGLDGATAGYPYDFLDVDKHGGVFVAVASVVITAGLTGLSLGYIKYSQRGEVSVSD